ncbi:DMT family transporter [Amycolatopsis sp., V23-08]|uniref:DMT family transporter n=1 Tax=Amycolatopsis heterodermiae TaxID=3110235 RepID=A0ABU5RB91_9PSEU|nr:DMT family transporter [Amycolatopsis sp., V23-08]MEA5363523.1 DMT family transporter [Amycolatopsis sp., V23-08]
MSKQIGIPPATLGLSALFVVCWSSGFIGAKLGAADAPVATVLMWRFVPLALVLLPALRRAGRAGLGRQVAVGLLSQSGYLLTVYWAIGLGVSTGTTALVDGIQPLVVAALAGPLLGVAVSGRQWLGLGLGLSGVVLVTWSDATSGRGTPLWAYLVPFAGMCCLVAATFLDRRTRERGSPWQAVAIHCATSAVVFTILAVATGAALPPASGRFWLAMAWLIVFATLGGYGLYWLLLDRAGVTRVNTLMFLVPSATTIWGALMFGEPFGPWTITGLALALAATWLVARTPQRSDVRDVTTRCSGDGSTASARPRSGAAAASPARRSGPAEC